MIEHLPADVANAIFDILVERAGASESMRDEFVYQQMGGCREFRFQGSLGSGGKLYVEPNRWRVAAYPEDRTPQRDATIGETNAALAGLHASHVALAAALDEGEAAEVDDGRRFGRSNPHCTNCGDERGGPFGHEISECRYRAGMTVAELADTMDPVRRSAYYETQVERYLNGALRERVRAEPDDLGPTVTETIDQQWSDRG